MGGALSLKQTYSLIFDAGFDRWCFKLRADKINANKHAVIKSGTQDLPLTQQVL